MSYTSPTLLSKCAFVVVSIPIRDFSSVPVFVTPLLQRQEVNVSLPNKDTGKKKNVNLLLSIKEL